MILHLFLGYRLCSQACFRLLHDDDDDDDDDVLNCRSSTHKVPTIHDLIADRNLDELFLIKTWFISDTQQKPQPVLLVTAPSGYAELIGWNLIAVTLPH